jgi:microcystin-dependent protein
MAFIIPNATDTASGAKYENLDQAEPDSLDFEILGNAGRSGVLSGCAVTALAASNTAVTVEGGVVVLNGQPYIVSGQASFGLPAAPTDARFDVIVVRVTGGNALLTTVKGNDELLNPEFPKSVNSLASGATFDGSINIDLETDVVLASVYRQGTQNITESRIVDRRVLHSVSISNQGTSAPSTNSGYTGNLYYRSNVIQGTTASGVYIKNSAGTWIELAQNNGPQVPVGSVISWLGSGAVPAGYLEANGQAVSRTTYADLFSVVGTQYGAGDGSTTFTLPNFNGKHFKGTTNTSLVGTATGSDTFTLSTSQLPSHSHTQSHTHTVNHAHTAVHGHTSNGTGSTGSHEHGDGNYAGTTSVHSGHNHGVSGSAGNHSGHTHGVSGNSGSAGSHNHEPSMYSLLQWNNSTWLVARRTSYVSQDGGYYSIPYSTNPPGTGMAVTYHDGAFTTHNGHSHGDGTYDADTGGSHSHTDGTYDADAGGNHSHTLNVSGNSASAGGHAHNVSISDSNVSTGTANPTSSGPSNNATGDTGSGSTISNVPSSVYARWLIRATGTVNATAEDGVQILEEAREEVVTIELSGSGALPASQADAAYYRVPWAATLTAVKANRNGTNTNGAVTIDVNEGGASVLSTEITIDQNEDTSLTAATPAVIGDSAIANDALLTFDIDSANTSDEGPLTVTLYFTRED